MPVADMNHKLHHIVLPKEAVRINKTKCKLSKIRIEHITGKILSITFAMNILENFS